MPKFVQKKLTQQKFDEKIKAGRGQGTRADYLPWIKFNEFRSRGNTYRIYSRRLGRMVVLFSNLEFFQFLLLEADPKVVDIREQFPLLYPEDIIQIAYSIDTQWGKRIEKKKQEQDILYVPTSDFRVTIQKGNYTVDRIMDVKPMKYVSIEHNPPHSHNPVSAKRIENQNRRFELAKNYWAQKGMTWEHVSDIQLQNQIGFIHNLDNLRNCRNLTHCPKYQQMDSVFQRVELVELLTSLALNNRTPLNVLTDEVDAILGLEPGTSLLMARHLIITRVWEVDLTQQVHSWAPLPITEATIEQITFNSRGIVFTREKQLPYPYGVFQ